MFTDVITKKENVWRTVEEPGYAIYAPSVLVLVMAIENGWRITNVECKPTEGDSSFYYTITLKSQSGLKSFAISLPQTTFLEKVLERQRALDKSIKI